MAVGSWVILRCAGRSTLRLAETLGADGFEVWTPSELQRFPGGKRAKHRIPIMPTFVFANASHLWTLVDRAEEPFAGFSVFRYLDRFPVIADEDLMGLREAEKQAVPKAERPAYTAGDAVLATELPYSGIPGTVVRCRNGEALVLFGWQRVKISTFKLKPNQAYAA